MFFGLCGVFKNMEPLSFDNPAETDVVRRIHIYIVRLFIVKLRLSKAEIKFINIFMNLELFVDVLRSKNWTVPQLL